MCEAKARVIGFFPIIQYLTLRLDDKAFGEVIDMFDIPILNELPSGWRATSAGHLSRVRSAGDD